MRHGQPRVAHQSTLVDLGDLPRLPGALCRGATVDLWHPPDTEGAGRNDEHEQVVRIAEAKSVCARCPDRVACGTWGIEHPQEVGIWGGMTAEQRTAIAHQISNPPRCMACFDIAHLRTWGIPWRTISLRLGQDSSWAQIHAARHGIKGEEGAA